MAGAVGLSRNKLDLGRSRCKIIIIGIFEKQLAQRKFYSSSPISLGSRTTLDYLGMSAL